MCVIKNKKMPKPERKAFKFYRSYFDLYLELPEEDKLSFIDALLKKQFYGEDPTNLKGFANFAYISQKHSIDSQVKGFEDKLGAKLTPPTEGGMQGGCQGGTEPPTEGPCLQEKEKEKEEGEYTHVGFDSAVVNNSAENGSQVKTAKSTPVDFELFWNSYHRITEKVKTDKEAAEKYWKKLTPTEKELAINNIQRYADSVSEKQYMKKARTYLSDKNFNDEFEKVIKPRESVEPTIQEVKDIQAGKYNLTPINQPK